MARDWLGEPAGHARPKAVGRIDRDAALAELARRYLTGHGPASDRDLARWAGVTLGDARRGLGAIGAELGPPVAGGLVDLARRAEVHPPPPPRLLGPFDPLLLGWVGRERVLGQHAGVVTVNGSFKAIALVGGRAVATWRSPAGEVVLEPLSPLTRRVATALERDARDVLRFLGRDPA